MGIAELLITACREGDVTNAVQYVERATAKDAMEVWDKDGWSALHAAATRDLSQVVSKIMQKPGCAHVDTPAPKGPREGQTVMHAAAAGGGMLVSNMLRQQYNANINATDAAGNTPLMLAAACCRDAEPRTVALWICKTDGVAVHHVNKAGFTALHLAVSNGPSKAVEDLVVAIVKKLAHSSVRQDVIRQRLSHTAAGVPPALCLAAAKGMMAAIKAMLDQIDSDLGTLDALVAEDDDGAIALDYAARNGNMTVVKYLHKALKDNGLKVTLYKNPTIPQEERFTKLLMSAVQGGEAVVVWLASFCTFSQNVRDKAGDTPLLMALASGHEKLAMDFIRVGADVNVVNFKGESALHLAAQEGLQDVVKHLLEKKARVDEGVPGNFYDTPLRRAVTNSHEKVAILLLVQGKAKLLPDKHTVLNMCQERRLDKLVHHIGGGAPTHPVRVAAELSQQAPPRRPSSPSSTPPSAVQGSMGPEPPVSASAPAAPASSALNSVVASLQGGRANLRRGPKTGTAASPSAGASRNRSVSNAGDAAPPPPAPPARPDSAPQLPSSFPRAGTNAGDAKEEEEEKGEDGGAEDATCVICLDAQRGCIIFPCAHLCLCVECANSVDKCPICRAKIEYRAQTTKIYSV